MQGPWLVPLGCLCLGAVLSVPLRVDLAGAVWILSWLLWPVAGGVLLDARPGHPLGLALPPAALAPGWLALTGTEATSPAALVATTILSPGGLWPLVAVPLACLAPPTRSEHSRRRLCLALAGGLATVLAALSAAAVLDELPAPVLFAAAAAVAATPLTLTWLAVTPTPPAAAAAAAVVVLALLGLAGLGTAHLAGLVVLRATGLAGPTAAAGLVTAAVALALAPGWVAVQRRLVARVLGTGRVPGSAHADLARRLRAPGSADLLAAVEESVAHALGSPRARVVTGTSSGTGPADEELADAVEVPLVLGPETVGTLRVAARRPGERFSRRDLRVLDTLAPQVAIAVRSAQLAQRLAAAEQGTRAEREAERRRVHADLHDHLGPLLSGIGMHVAAARSAAADRGGNADGTLARRMDDVTDALEQCRQQVRRLARDLEPPAAGPASLAEDLRSMVDQWQRAAEGTPAPRFCADVATVPPVDRRVETCLRTVAGEAFTNVVRHAGAGVCHLTLLVEDAELVLCVTDDGVGIGEAPWGVGLSSMRERLQRVGGTLRIGTPDGGGTQLRAAVPLPRAQP
jgi:signal transduction histidine kinase